MRRSFPAVAGVLFLLAPAVASAQKPDCTIRPPRGTGQPELSRMAKISEKDAESRAVASVSPNKVSSIISSQVEVVNGCLAWPFDLRFSNKGGVQEVVVDAGDGRILSSEYEAPSGNANDVKDTTASNPAESASSASAGEAGAGATNAPAAAPSEAAIAAEEPRVRKLVDEQEDAWNRGDAKAFASRFGEDGALTDIFGSIVRGRADIEKRQADLFTAYFKGSLIGLKVRKVRFLRADVALVEIDTELTRFHKAPPNVYVDGEKVIRSRVLEVVAKAGNDWTVASFSNVEVKTPPVGLDNPEDPLNRRARPRK